MPVTVTLSRVWAAICAAIVLALVIALAVQTVRIEGFRVWPLSHKGLKAQRDEAVEGRKADRAAYEAAQAKAKADNLTHVRNVEQQQKAKTDAIQSRWDADRARLADLMRRNSAAKGPAGPAGTPAIPNATPGPDGAGQVCIPEGDALSAAENELKLFYLQEWLREQLKVAR
jgi:hypothetical protein